MRSTRARWAVVVIVIVVVAAIVVPVVYRRSQEGPAPAPFALDATQVLDRDVDLEGQWSVASGSEAGYRADEVMGGTRDEVVGRTSRVSGEVTIVRGSTTSGWVSVDLADVRAINRPGRDVYFDRTLRTDRYRDGQLVLIEPVDVSGLMSGGGTVVQSVRGVLTLAGTPRIVQARLTIAADGDRIQVLGRVPVSLDDYDLEPPDFGWARLEPDATIEVHLSLAHRLPDIG